MFMRNQICTLSRVITCSVFLMFFVPAAESARAAAAAPAKVAAPAPKAVAPAAVPKAAAPAAPEPEDAAAGAEESEDAVEDPIDMEIRFMKALIRLRLPDYAQKALDKLVAAKPEAKARASSIKIDILAGVGNYAAAEKMIEAMPADTLETWVMKLSLAEHYYSAAKMAEAKAGYDAFFKKYEKGPPAGMEKFYMEQAYKFAQMLMFKNEEKAAVDAFRCVLLAKPERDVEFKIRIDLAELCIKLAEKTKDVKERDDFLKKAKEAAEPVLWKDPGGPLFGKGIIMLAHAEMIRGDKKAAKKLIDTYMPMLKDLEAVLKKNEISLDFSPMAECRYMLGTIAEDEGMALLKQGQKKEAQDALISALTHFVNVVAKYQTGQWAIPAGDGQDRIMAVLKNQLGITPQVPPFDRTQIMKSLLKDAQSKFEQNLFAEAAKKYLIYVNGIPEHDTSVAALGELAKCYLELGNTNYYYVVIGYLGERFNSNPQVEDNAGNALLRAAAAAETLNNKELRQKTYDYYIKYFKNHKRMAGVLYQFGETKVKERNYDQAIEYFQKIATNSLYAKSAVYFPALGKTAFCYTMLNDYSNAVEVLSKTVKDLQPGPDEIETRYRLADTYRRMDKIVPAINEFVAVINGVAGSNKAAYAKTPEDVIKTKSIMESVSFWKAYCYALLNKGYPPEQLKNFQQKAIDDFTTFVTTYPKSTLASTALSRLGSLLYASGKSDEANKIFDRLVKEYPDAPESKDVVFVQGMGLIELRQMPRAIEVFGKMLANEKAFTAPQFLRVGRIMAEAKEYPTAIKFFERSKALATRDKAVDRAIWEPSVYGIGEANFLHGNSAETVKAIEELFARYKSSTMGVDASFILSKAYADLGSKEKDGAKKKSLFVNSRATIAKGITMIPQTNTVMRFKANFQIADVQILLGEKDQATASYYRMLTFGDWNDADIKPLMEEAVGKGLALIAEKEQFAEDVINIATKYLEACPRGKYIREANRIMTAAKLKMAMSGRKMSVDTGAAPEAAAPAPAAGAEPAASNAAPVAPAATLPAAPQAAPVAPAGK